MKEKYTTTYKHVIEKTIHLYIGRRKKVYPSILHLSCILAIHVSLCVRKPTIWVSDQVRVTQTGLYSHRSRLEACTFGFKMKKDFTIRAAKTKALISCAVTAQLICGFVFAYAKCWFSNAVAMSNLCFHVILMKFAPLLELDTTSDFCNKKDLALNLVWCCLSYQKKKTKVGLTHP